MWLFAVPGRKFKPNFGNEGAHTLVGPHCCHGCAICDPKFRKERVDEWTVGSKQRAPLLQNLLCILLRVYYTQNYVRVQFEKKNGDEYQM